MTAMLRQADPSRRALLAGGGALIVSFSLSRALAQEAQNKGEEPRQAPLPGSLKDSPMLDSWIRIAADGSMTVFTGKAELGQGIKTALLQIAAEQLGVDPAAITLITADTSQTPNEGYTAGSHSMQDSGTAILHAAAQAREILIGLAATRLSLPAERLKAEARAIVAEDGRKVSFGELVAGDVLHVRAQPQSRLKEPSAHTIMGRAVPRVDIPAKVTGGVSYVQDLRLPGMVHARVVRPPSYSARLRELDSSRVERAPGVLKIVRDGSFLAVVAEREYQAVQAMRALGEAASWNEDNAAMPDESDIFSYLEGVPTQDTTILNAGQPSSAANIMEASYHRPYQIHGSIGPSCAVGLFDNDALTIWTHSQGVYQLRKAVAEMLKIAPEQVRCIHMEGSGCYGHNGADDVAADAALTARAFPGRPVRVQWMREDEHAWEPYGPAMITKARAALDADGRIADWEYHVWSNTHSTRPGAAGNLLPALHLAAPFTHPPPRPLPQPEGGGDRNAIPLYKLPNARVVHHFIPSMPLRVSALRGLGAYMNIFSLESFMDELATAAAADPVEFRLRHLDDERARAVIETAAERFGWRKGERLPQGRGRGFAFARYKNLGAYAAIAVEVEVDRESGRVRVKRAVAATDSGEAVNPDGIRNQIEGGIIQSASWTLYEAVSFDTTRVTSRDWSSYPIMRFAGVPDSIDVHVIDRPGQPFLGTGEAAQGPAAAAIANGVADAIGARLRDLPLTPERVKRAIGV
ncbi:MAG: molybdopterin cofactor-binding domain-containing protein [Xanthobacteraceae bacterium]